MATKQKAAGGWAARKQTQEKMQKLEEENKRLTELNDKFEKDLQTMYADKLRQGISVSPNTTEYRPKLVETKLDALANANRQTSEIVERLEGFLLRMGLGSLPAYRSTQSKGRLMMEVLEHNIEVAEINNSLLERAVAAIEEIG